MQVKKEETKTRQARLRAHEGHLKNQTTMWGIFGFIRSHDIPDSLVIFQFLLKYKTDSFVKA